MDFRCFSMNFKDFEGFLNKNRDFPRYKVCLDRSPRPVGVVSFKLEISYALIFCPPKYFSSAKKVRSKKFWSKKNRSKKIGRKIFRSKKVGRKNVGQIFQKSKFSKNHERFLKKSDF